MTYWAFLDSLDLQLGLVLIVITGSELFTGDVMFMSLGKLTGKVTWKQFVINWVVVYLGNWAGTTLFALLIWGTGMVSTDPWLTFTQNLTVGKLSPNWGVLFLKAIPANMLVCLAVYVAMAAEDIISKIVGIWLPIAAFILCGFEHSVANMFFCTIGLFLGASSNYGIFLYNNLLSVTLGNIAGAIIFVTLVYWYAHYVTAPASAPVQTAVVPAVAPTPQKVANSV